MSISYRAVLFGIIIWSACSVLFAAVWSAFRTNQKKGFK